MGFSEGRSVTFKSYVKRASAFQSFLQACHLDLVPDWDRSREWIRVRRIQGAGQVYAGLFDWTHKK